MTRELSGELILQSEWACRADRRVIPRIVIYYYEEGGSIRQAANQPAFIQVSQLIASQYRATTTWLTWTSSVLRSNRTSVDGVNGAPRTTRNRSASRSLAMTSSDERVAWHWIQRCTKRPVCVSCSRLIGLHRMHEAYCWCSPRR